METARAYFAPLLLIVASLSLTTARIGVAGKATYVWLYWDVFLAFVPLCLGGLACAVGAHSRWLAAAVSILWLLFLPNAPYLLTEFVHLRLGQPSTFWWLDVSMLGLVGCTGLCIYAQSVRHVVGFWSARRAYSGALSALIALLSGLAIRVGRIERWNSWDVAVRPGELVHIVWQWCMHPLTYGEVWLTAALFATVLLVIGAAWTEREGDIK